jgi:carboxymethylenebutenolidase
MQGKMISISATDRGSFGGYLATPESGSGPGLVLLQEIFGVNRHIREVADLFAEEGYVVLAPDLFWRIQPGVELGYSDADFQAALRYYQRLDVDRAILDVGDALRALRAHPSCTGRVGAIGFCLGGTLAYLAAARLPIDAAVSYYGVGIEGHLDEAESIKCPIVLHFAAEDEFVPAAARA